MNQHPVLAHEVIVGDFAGAGFNLQIIHAGGRVVPGIKSKWLAVFFRRDILFKNPQAIFNSIMVGQI